MCLAVFLGTTQPVGLRPWSEGRSLGVSDVNPSQVAVRAILATPHVYDICAWEGCGCGFVHGVWPVLDEDDRVEQQRNAESIRALAALLRELLTRERPLRLHACWIGDEALAVRSTRRVSVQDFDREIFEFKESELLLVEP